MWHGRGNSGGSWPPAFPHSPDQRLRFPFIPIPWAHLTVFRLIRTKYFSSFDFFWYIRTIFGSFWTIFISRTNEQKKFTECYRLIHVVPREIVQKDNSLNGSSSDEIAYISLRFIWGGRESRVPLIVITATQICFAVSALLNW